ncbi:myoglobin [Solea solea]|uniref:myoglobin n=1 Tax=Solea solea TaxID=90069 RepID=UPI0027297799|nr:myoglobin [Solea solea]
MADFDKVLCCWPAVEADFPGVGNLVLTRLFEQYPATQAKFTKFATVPHSELPSNKLVSAHGATVLKKLGELLNARGSHGDIIAAMAETHANTHKVTIQNFKDLTEIIVNIMAEKAGLNGEGQAALRRIMTIVINDMEANYKKIGFKG